MAATFEFVHTASMATADRRGTSSASRDSKGLNSSSHEELSRRPWTPQALWNKLHAFHSAEITGFEWQEDELLLKLIAKHGTNNWSIFALTLKGRSGKQCCERY
jgi:hypothetical protein